MIIKSASSLFVFSLVWKISNSNLNDILKMSIPNPVNEEIRIFLNKNLKDNNGDLIKAINELSSIPDYGHYVFKCETRNQFTRGIYTAYEFSKDSFGIFLVDLIFFFYSDKTAIPLDFQIFKNIDTENALIALAPLKEWKKINSGPLKNIGR